MQVRFTKRYCAWWPGANPTIDDALAQKLIAEGYCEPAVDEPTEVDADAPTLPPVDGIEVKSIGVDSWDGASTDSVTLPDTKSRKRKK